MSGQAAMTRRSLAALLGGAAAVATGAMEAQAETQVQAPADSAEAEAALRRNSEALAKVAVPAETEPAFRFQA